MTKERVYVKVSSDFDSTGYMQPTSITWSDGRTFPIETVRDFRPAGTADNGYSGDCFTVLMEHRDIPHRCNIDSHSLFQGIFLDRYSDILYQKIIQFFHYSNRF